MKFFSPKRLRRAGLGTAIAGVLCFAIVPSSSFAATHQAIPSSPTVSPNAPYYLALGDSVTFGFRERTTVPLPDYAESASFIGYPEDIGAALGWHVANAACSGETSASLIAKNAPSFGCENAPGGLPAYRSTYPLHEAYGGSQLQYAVQYLHANPHTRLVSLMIGVNDGFLCQEATTDKCASEVPEVAKQISDNVAHILGAIRNKAKYAGQIVIVNYYSPDYADQVDSEEAMAVNEAEDSGARRFHVTIADGYAAFEEASLQSGGDTCAAGLLTQLSTGGCGIHPSMAGQAILALAVERVIRR